jgi:hypothetical protein
MQRRRNWRPVAILSPDDLIAQATKLIRPPPAGPPLQVDFRRAISSAYYAVFHLTLAAAADVVVGRIHRGSPNYALVYRSVDHRGFKELCEVTRKSSLPAKYRNHGPAGGFGPDLKGFASAAAALQEARHEADYDPRPRFRTSKAVLQIDLARTALHHWAAAPPEQRATFLMLLLFPPR